VAAGRALESAGVCVVTFGRKALQNEGIKSKHFNAKCFKNVLSDGPKVQQKIPIMKT
jgi:hypothetical protein